MLYSDSLLALALSIDAFFDAAVSATAMDEYRAQGSEARLTNGVWRLTGKQAVLPNLFTGNVRTGQCCAKEFLH